ncbi:MAG: type II toxin-antitoxin system death-on-curing family toxin [Clostridia bacterium]|nr:type II toxin-antitoxin system death-on-curing family toxin [Clostridia bacterium]
MIKFDEEKVLLLHQFVIESTGGSYELRDIKLLDSALSSAFQTFDNKELFPTKEEKGAKLGYSLVSNHAFVDGNKRIGLLVMLSFLEINGIHLKYTDDELIELGLGLASDKVSYEELLSWINSHKTK